MSKTRNDAAEIEGRRLSSVERLLVIGLIKDGLSQTHVAAALGMHQTTLSRSFPKGLLSEVARSRSLVETSNGYQAGERTD